MRHVALKCVLLAIAGFVAGCAAGNTANSTVGSTTPQSVMIDSATSFNGVSVPIAAPGYLGEVQEQGMRQTIQPTIDYVGTQAGYDYYYIQRAIGAEYVRLAHPSRDGVQAMPLQTDPTRWQRIWPLRLDYDLIDDAIIVEPNATDADAPLDHRLYLLPPN